MPTYEYKCAACDHAFEKFQSMSAAPVRKCPVCGKSKVKRLLGTGAGLIFKGSGFYITDYRSESYKSGEKGEKPATGSASGESKADSKTEAKTENRAATTETATKAPAAPATPSKSESKASKKSR